MAEDEVFLSLIHTATPTPPFRYSRVKREQSAIVENHDTLPIPLHSGVIFGFVCHSIRHSIDEEAACDDLFMQSRDLLLDESQTEFSTTNFASCCIWKCHVVTGASEVRNDGNPHCSNLDWSVPTTSRSGIVDGRLDFGWNCRSSIWAAMCS